MVEGGIREGPECVCGGPGLATCLTKYLKGEFGQLRLIKRFWAWKAGKKGKIHLQKVNRTLKISFAYKFSEIWLSLSFP